MECFSVCDNSFAKFALLYVKNIYLSKFVLNNQIVDQSYIIMYLHIVFANKLVFFYFFISQILQRIIFVHHFIHRLLMTY